MNQEAVHILVVDDELPIRLTISDLLRRRGFQVTQAADGVEALELVLAQPFDLLLLDIELPRLNGLEVAQRARQHQPDLAIVFLTGQGLIEEVAEPEQATIEFLHKTASPQDVLEHVSRQLGRNS